jgi:type IV pilus assembly protein PilA
MDGCKVAETALFLFMAMVAVSAQTADAGQADASQTASPQTSTAPEAVPAQTPAAVPTAGPGKKEQTARQALLEMLLGKTPGAFEKHLPSATQEFVKTDFGAMPMATVASMLGQLQQPGSDLETFETGSTLLRVEEPRNEGSIELSVEDEIDGGDEAQLRLALHIYRGGRAMPLPFVPTFVCRMMMEEDVWRLNEIALDLRLPLGDAGWLDEVKQKVEKGTAQAHEMLVLRRMRMLLAAELTYANAYPAVGFTCTASDLAGSDAGHPGPRAAMLIQDEAASPLADEYAFVLSDCRGAPAKHFRLAAVPENPENGERAFCSDESGKIRFAEDGRAASCLEAGERLP